MKSKTFFITSRLLFLITILLLAVILSSEMYINITNDSRIPRSGSFDQETNDALVNLAGQELRTRFGMFQYISENSYMYYSLHSEDETFPKSVFMSIRVYGGLFRYPFLTRPFLTQAYIFIDIQEDGSYAITHIEFGR